MSRFETTIPASPRAEKRRMLSVRAAAAGGPGLRPGTGGWRFRGAAAQHVPAAGCPRWRNDEEHHADRTHQYHEYGSQDLHGTVRCIPQGETVTDHLSFVSGVLPGKLTGDHLELCLGFLNAYPRVQSRQRRKRVVPALFETSPPATCEYIVIGIQASKEARSRRPGNPGERRRRWCRACG